MENLEDIYMEGWIDRLKARGAGLAGGIEAASKNVGNIFTGGKNVSPQDAYRQQKLASITNTFANEMKALFGDKWSQTYSNLANALNALQSPQTATPPPLPTAPTATSTTQPTPEKSVAPEPEPSKYLKTQKELIPDTEKEWIAEPRITPPAKETPAPAAAEEPVVRQPTPLKQKQPPKQPLPPDVRQKLAKKGSKVNNQILNITHKPAARSLNKNARYEAEKIAALTKLANESRQKISIDQAFKALTEVEKL